MTEIDLTTVSDNDYKVAELFLKESVRDMYPEMDLDTGSAFNDVVVTPSAKLLALSMNEINDFYNGYDLDNSALIQSDSTVDATLGRYFLSRNVGATAKGLVNIIVNTFKTYVIPAGASFKTDSGLEFTLPVSVRAVTDEALLTNLNDVLLKPYKGDQFYFTVSVEAVAVGTQYNIVQNTSLTFSTTLSEVSSSFAAASFTGGADAESNAEAISRLPERFSVATVSTVPSIKNLIFTSTGINDVSVVSKGNTALLRDSRNSLGMSSGGFADVYVRSSIRPNIQLVELEAVLVDPAANRWRLYFDGQDYPGLYSVLSISPIGRSGSLTIISRTSGINTATLPPEITILNPQDAVFSLYGTQLVEFTDDTTIDTSLPIGTKQTYLVSLFSAPSLSASTELLTAPEVQNPGIDLLVRNVTPALLSVSFTIKKYAGDAEIDLVKVKNDIITAIQDLGLGIDSVDSSVVLGAVQKSLGSRSFVLSESVGMSARVLDHKLKESITISNVITIAPRVEEGVSVDTLGFLTDESLISVQIEQYT